MSDDTRVGQTATQAGSPNTPRANDERRLSNPLSKYASYTYQLALYAITPEYYRVYKSTNFLDTRDPSVALILQSGGVNNNSNRAAGFEFDYYIDDLKLEAYVAPESRQTSTVTYGIEFKIYESLGFRFITNLFQTLQSLKSVSNELKDLSNSSRQLFVLTIKFLGYDIQGKPIQDDIILGLNKYYDIICTGIKFKLDGGITVYNFKGVVTSMDVMGPKKGLVDKGAYNLYGSTVGDVLNKLMAKLTEDRKRNNNNTPSDTFRVEFVGSGADEIKNATFATPENSDKQTNATTPPNIKSTNQVTPTVELKAVPRSNEKEIKINGGTPITKAVEEIIKLSSYNSDALAKVVSNDKQPGPGEQQKGANKKFASYFMTPVINSVKRNEVTKDYVYDIVYKIQKYETPDISAPYVTQTSSYYGPVKEYKYYYTGENSEVIRFEQEFDNTFFTVSLNADGSIIPRRVDGDVPVSTATPSGGSPQGVNNPATLTPQNSAITYLLDPAKIANAKIEILGDPDWLGQDIVSTTRYINENNKTINYSAQQVFIEIKVQEPIDYNHRTGVLDLNENILFWSYPESKRNELKGKISYRVVKVTSTFKSGKFTQVLECVITTFPADPKPENQTNTGQNASGTPTPLTTSGLTKVKDSTSRSDGSTTPRTGLNSISPQVTIGGVVNDDASTYGNSGLNISGSIVAP